MTDWLMQLCNHLPTHESVVRVTVIAARGSTPRETGACMLVYAHGQQGTIGGGHLEWNATALAHEILADGLRQPGLPTVARRKRYVLGASLGQCCGGAVELSFEHFDLSDRAFLQRGLEQLESGKPLLLAHAWIDDVRISRRWIDARELESIHTDPLFANARQAMTLMLGASRHDTRACLSSSLSKHDAGTLAGPRTDLWLERVDPASVPLWIFGAGHVARALVPILAPLPFSIHWIDNRSDAFDGFADDPARLACIPTDDPVSELEHAPSNALHLVMTHQHDLDFALCHALLSRHEFARLGLIGSGTKNRRFIQRLSERGIEPRQIARMTCPIGVPGIHGKLPAAIAVAVAAQLLQWIEQADQMAQNKTIDPSFCCPTEIRA